MLCSLEQCDRWNSIRACACCAGRNSLKECACLLEMEAGETPPHSYTQNCNRAMVLYKPVWTLASGKHTCNFLQGPTCTWATTVIQYNFIIELWPMSHCRSNLPL